MISTGDLRKGATIELDNELWQILDYHHIKMGRGSAQVRITLRNVSAARPSSARSRPARSGRAPRSSSGPSSSSIATATTSTSWTPTRTTSSCSAAEQLGDATSYLKDGMTLDRTSYQGETIGVELPVTVDLMVARPSPASPATPPRARARARRPRPGSSSRCRSSSTRATRSASTPGPGEYQTRL